MPVITIKTDCLNCKNKIQVVINHSFHLTETCFPPFLTWERSTSPSASAVLCSEASRRMHRADVWLTPPECIKDEKNNECSYKWVIGVWPVIASAAWSHYRPTLAHELFSWNWICVAFIILALPGAHCRDRLGHFTYATSCVHFLPQFLVHINRENVKLLQTPALPEFSLFFFAFWVWRLLPVPLSPSTVHDEANCHETWTCECKACW